MIIKLSKAQWESIGKQAGWVKTADLGLYEFESPKSKAALVTSKQEFDVILDSLLKSIEQWRSRYVRFGANDTAARDEQLKYIQAYIRSML